MEKVLAEPELYQNSLCIYLGKVWMLAKRHPSRLQVKGCQARCLEVMSGVERGRYIVRMYWGFIPLGSETTTNKQPNLD